MSDITTAVHAYLQTRSGITDIAGTRGYPGKLAQGATLPAYTTELVSTDSEEHLLGAAGISHGVVQISCIADTALEANALREQVRLAMQGFNGDMGSVTIRGCSHAGTFDAFMPTPAGSDAGFYFRSIDFRLSYLEALPTNG